MRIFADVFIFNMGGSISKMQLIAHISRICYRIFVVHNTLLEHGAVKYICLT